MTGNTYNARPATLLKSAVDMESQWRRMSRIIPTNIMLQAYIHKIQPTVKDDL